MAPARAATATTFSAPKFNVVGAAFGAHARYRTVCSIDFAGGYAERSDALVAK